MNAFVLSCLASLGFIGCPIDGKAAQPFSLQTAQQDREWTVNYQGRKLLVYSYGPEKFKPYVKELCTLRGDNILRDAPYDHLHHHALMYGIKVNGVNFWEEISGSGIQKVVQSSNPQVTSDVVRLEQTLHWLNPQDAFLPNDETNALLVEQRILTLKINEQDKEVALHWRSRFSVGGKTNQVTLTGANYHGLGIRFLEELDPLALHQNEQEQLNLQNNRQDTTRHAWTAIAFDRPSQGALIALFGNSRNARDKSWFFSMKTPFAYLSATQGLDLEPLIYRAGEQFELNYLVTLYPEIKPYTFLQKRAESWETSGK